MAPVVRASLQLCLLAVLFKDYNRKDFLPTSSPCNYVNVRLSYMKFRIDIQSIEGAPMWM